MSLCSASSTSSGVKGFLGSTSQQILQTFRGETLTATEPKLTARDERGGASEDLKGGDQRPVHGGTALDALDQESVQRDAGGEGLDEADRVHGVW